MCGNVVCREGVVPDTNEAYILAVGYQEIHSTKINNGIRGKIIHFTTINIQSDVSS